MWQLALGQIANTAAMGGLLSRVSSFAGTINLASTGAMQETTGASATTPAIADGNPVGSIKNLGTRGGWRTAPANPNRPTLKIVSGKTLMRLDGSDDVMVDVDPYLYAAGASGVFLAYKAAVQTSSVGFLFCETSGASANPVYCPGFRWPNSDQSTGYMRNDVGAAFSGMAPANVGGGYAGGPRVLGVIDTGSQLIPYNGKTAGTPVNYTRSGTLTLTRSAIGALASPSISLFVAVDLYGLIAMGGVPTTQQISDIVDLLNLEAGI